MRSTTVSRVRSFGFLALLLAVMVAITGCRTLAALAVGTLVGGIVGVSVGTTHVQYDSIGRPVYSYGTPTGFGGAPQLDIVNDLPFSDVVLDVRIDGRIRASDIHFGENRLVGLEAFGVVPGKRYTVFIVGRKTGTASIVGSEVVCVSPGSEPNRETILLHIGRLSPSGRGSRSC